MTGSGSHAPHPKAQFLAELGVAAGPLRVGGLLAQDLADRFGTPLYVYDAAVLRRTLAQVRAQLGPRTEVFYALKANPNAAVGQVFARAGAGAEVASAGEIHIARRAGFAAEQIQFAGPGKNVEDLDLALSVGIGWINLESPAEYAALRARCVALGRRARVAIRVNPKTAISGSRMRMGGGSKKFGVDEDEVLALARTIVADGRADLRGLHVYAGTQSFDADSWVGNAQHLLELATAVEQALGAPLQTLNFGGGFGVATFEGDPEFDLARAGRTLQALITREQRPERRYLVELGRYLTAAAGVYLTRVVYLKRSQGRQHAILDGGMHQHGAATGLGAVIRRTFPVVACADVGAAPAARCTLGGPLCTPADELAPDLELPELAAGDLLAVLASGAYGLTFSNVLFLSHPLPAEILVDAGSAHLVRARGHSEDSLRGQRLPMDPA